MGGGECGRVVFEDVGVFHEACVRGTDDVAGKEG